MPRRKIILVRMGDPLTKIPPEHHGKTRPLYCCLGLGFYNPTMNTGYLLHYYPPIPKLFEQQKEHFQHLLRTAPFEGNTRDYHTRATGLIYLHNPEWDQRSSEVARHLQQLLVPTLEELGFDPTKFQERYRCEGSKEESGCYLDLNTRTHTFAIRIRHGTTDQPFLSYYTVHGSLKD